MIPALLTLSIPLLIILIMVLITLHRTNISDIKIGNIKQAVQIGVIGSLVILIAICFIFLCFIMIPPIPKIEIGRVNKNATEGVVCSKNKLNYLYNPFYSLFYRVGVYIEHPDKPGVLSQTKKHVAKLNWWDGEWKVQGMNVKGSDTIHVLLIKRAVTRNNKYYPNLKKEKGCFSFEDEQIPYGKDKEAEIIDYDAKTLE
ncbi:MAG: hypothetical protein V1749_10120 [Candidatus Desantisbacteria bacterium]